MIICTLPARIERSRQPAEQRGNSPFFVHINTRVKRVTAREVHCLLQPRIPVFCLFLFLFLFFVFIFISCIFFVVPLFVLVTGVSYNSSLRRCCSLRLRNMHLFIVGGEHQYGTWTYWMAINRAYRNQKYRFHVTTHTRTTVVVSQYHTSGSRVVSAVETERAARQNSRARTS